MSRRSRHGRHPHPPTAAESAPLGPRSEPGTAAAPAVRAPQAPPRDALASAATGSEHAVVPDLGVTAGAAAKRTAVAAAERAEAVGAASAEAAPRLGPEPRSVGLAPNGMASAPGPAQGGGADEGDWPRTTCTQAQLRRFIKSRPWIPMHELRRRFGIPGGDDDVTPVHTRSGTVFVGLPPAEGRLLGELLNGGDVGYELSLDPDAPIVVGVYPMRPVPRG